MVVKNLAAILITIVNGIKVTQVIAVNVVPPVELASGTLGELNVFQGIQWTRILVGEEENSAPPATRSIWP